MMNECPTGAHELSLQGLDGRSYQGEELLMDLPSMNAFAPLKSVCTLGLNDIL